MPGPLERDLESGEKLLWSGAPRTGIRFASTDVYFIALALVALAPVLFSILLPASAFVAKHGRDLGGPPPPAFIWIWRTPWLLAAAFLLVGRYFVEAWVRARTRYGVTDGRILIRKGDKLQSLPLGEIREMSIEAAADGSGQIFFGPTTYKYLGAMLRRAGRMEAPSFQALDGAQQVYELIRGAWKPPAR